MLRVRLGRRHFAERAPHPLGVGTRRLDRSWARRSFAPATMRIARVICCVFSTPSIRRLMSLRFATLGRYSPFRASWAGTRSAKGVERGSPAWCSVSSSSFLCRDRLETSAWFVHVLEHLGLVAPDTGRRARRSRTHEFRRRRVARRARVDRDDLLFHRRAASTGAASASRSGARRSRAAPGSPCRDRCRTVRRPPSRGTARG